MADGQSVGLVVAFSAGVLSFLSPCVLPLVPSYIGFLTGMTANEVTSRRHLAVLHALMFVAGFSLIFIVLGASATALGKALNYYRDWIQRVGGVLIILFGLVCLDVIKFGFLKQEKRFHLEDKPVGFLGSGLVGMAFGAGWTPCIGPILGSVLGLAATEQDLSRGILLLACYSAGLALPFILAAVALDRFFGWFQKFRRYLPWVLRVSGILLIIVGILMVTGSFTKLAGWLQQLTPDFLKEQL
ncbi:MAG TPA: cytochrome c biogenesis CcdA family protein [Gemmatimonadales bacterium]|nr:cytochrome c biogenesis CcdA family protein [Gemmatimonadales bacterium]